MITYYSYNLFQFVIYSTLIVIYLKTFNLKNILEKPGGQMPQLAPLPDAYEEQ